MIKPIREIDVYFTTASWQLAALRHYHELIERELPSIIRARGLPGWDGEGPAPGKVVVAQFHQTLIDGMLPGVLRGPLLLSLWAVYESTLIEIAEFLRVPANLSFGLTDVKIPKHIQPQPNGILNRALHVYEKELGLTLFIDEQMQTHIRGFYGLRNILAHAGGIMRSSKPADWNKVVTWASQHPGLDFSHGRILIEADFVRVQMELIASATQHIIQQVRQKLPELGIARR